MQADLVLYNIGQLVTSRELDNSKKMDNIEVIENNGYIVIEKDKIVAVGSGEFQKNIFLLQQKW
jgi:imidazolonepropionase